MAEEVGKPEPEEEDVRVAESRKEAVLRPGGQRRAEPQRQGEGRSFTCEKVENYRPCFLGGQENYFITSRGIDQNLWRLPSRGSTPNLNFSE